MYMCLSAPNADHLRSSIALRPIMKLLPHIITSPWIVSLPERLEDGFGRDDHYWLETTKEQIDRSISSKLQI